MKINGKDGQIIKDVSGLEKLIDTCCDGTEKYKFVAASSSCIINITGEKLIYVDEDLLKEVKSLVKYDKKYMSALKMTVYHEIGHDKIYGKEKNKDFEEALAELYAINEGDIEDYIIEIAVISRIEGDKLSSFNGYFNENKNVIDYLLKHDYADKWMDPGFISKVGVYGFAKNALKNVNLSYNELADKVLEERNKIDRLKSENNLFIDKDMITRK
ncbi:MAG: hypothetical protein QXL94_04665 [Candidatus Parvarchaeum sp.]